MAMSAEERLARKREYDRKKSDAQVTRGLMRDGRPMTLKSFSIRFGDWHGHTEDEKQAHIRDLVTEVQRLPDMTPCWIPLKRPNKFGYVAKGFTSGGARAEWKMHRLVAHTFNGPLPKDEEVHHICHQRDCCNPTHLIATTPELNQLESHRATTNKKRIAELEERVGYLERRMLAMEIERASLW